VQIKTFHLAFLLLFAVPAIAQSSSGYLDQSGSWQWEHDNGTPGSSTGQLIFGVANPSVDGSATEFVVSYSDYGGERFHLVFGNDTAATYFVYDTYVYLVNPTQVQNLELDMDQVTANGETIISARSAPASRARGSTPMLPVATDTGGHQTSPATHRTGRPTSGTISRSSRTVSEMLSLTTG